MTLFNNESFDFTFFLALYSYQYMVLIKLLNWILWLYVFYQYQYMIQWWFQICYIYSIFVLIIQVGYTFYNIFIIFIPSDKNSISFWSWCNFSEYWKSTSRKYPIALFSLKFFKKSSLGFIIKPLKTTYRYLLRHYLYTYYLHCNTYYMIILYLYHNFSCICYWLLHTDE